MTLSEYRDTYSWQAAIELGPKLTRLAEELPGIEEMGLSLHLRQLMVELPASIASDLTSDSKSAGTVILKLITVLELVEHVYPALDATDTRRSTDELASRILNGNIAEVVVATPPAPQATSVSPEMQSSGAEVSVSPDGLVGEPNIIAPTSEAVNVQPNSDQ